MTAQPPKRLAVFFSTGDLGDVGRHVVSAVLELPSQSPVKVFARNVETMLLQTPWKCACRDGHHVRQEGQEEHLVDRVLPVELDCTTDSIVEHLQDIDVIVTCLGNRQLFHPECIAHVGTQRILQAAMNQNIRRVVVLSSVGISEDWPPMKWSQEGRRLESYFRTICWCQFQDLTGAEKAVRAIEKQRPDLSLLLVRAVLISETAVPSGSWCVQQRKDHDDHPEDNISKMDCARFLVQEAIYPSLHRCAVTVGGVPTNAAQAAQP
jgi:hypothetical protein